MDNVIDDLYRSLLGNDSIPERLRLKREVTNMEFNELIDKVEKLVEYYKDKDYVPKKLAACFVDIYNQFSLREDFYPTEKLNLFEDIGVKLQELAYELFDE